MLRIPLLALMVAIVLSATFCLWPAAKLAAEPMSAGSLSGGASAPEMPEIKDAETRFGQRDFDGALKLLKDAAKKDPDQPPANVTMAYWFSAAAGEDRRLGSMIRPSLERAAMEAPRDPEAYLMMGRIAMSEGRVTEAGLLFGKSSDLLLAFTASPKRKAKLTKMLYSGLAEVAGARGEYPVQQQQLEALLRIDPKDVGTLTTLAHCLFEQKKPDAAIEKLKDAAKINRSSGAPETTISQWYLASGDKENAAKWMAVALAAAPKDVNTRLAAAQLAFATGQLEETKKQAEEARKINPNSVQAKLILGWVAMFQKDFKTAENYLDSADRLPNKSRGLSFLISNNLALALVEQKDEAKKNRAQKIAEQNVQQNPRNGDAVATYGWVLFKRQGENADDAEKYLRHAINDLGNTSPDTLYQFATILHRRGHDAEAKLWLEQALKSTQPFSYRDEARALLVRVQG